MGSKKKILAVGAHPDDVELMISGTLVELFKKGHEVAIATVATGDKGSAELTNREIAKKRYQEAANAASVLDSKYYCLGESDCEIVFDNPTRAKMVELIRCVSPDIIITNSPQDYVPDHQITSDLAWDGAFGACIVNYITHHPDPAEPLDRAPYLYYADPLEGKDRFGQRVTPEFYIDITASVDMKVEMLSKHESQREWLRMKHGMDEYVNSMKAWGQERGRECGVEYAEGYRQHKGSAFFADNVLGELLPVIYS